MLLGYPVPGEVLKDSSCWCWVEKRKGTHQRKIVTAERHPQPFARQLGCGLIHYISAENPRGFDRVPIDVARKIYLTYIVSKVVDPSPSNTHRTRLAVAYLGG